MRLRLWCILCLCGVTLASFAGCETNVTTDSPPPARVEVETKPAPTSVDVDVKPPAQPATGVDVNVKPGASVDVDVKKNP
jgi:hypothetical protein